jgi:hypothetical protein
MASRAYGRRGCLCGILLGPYAAFVRSIVRMGQWMGMASRFEMPIPEVRTDDADGYVVIVQRAWGDVIGPILAAGKSNGL